MCRTALSWTTALALTPLSLTLGACYSAPDRDELADGEGGTQVSGGGLTDGVPSDTGATAGTANDDAGEEDADEGGAEGVRLDAPAGDVPPIVDDCPDGMGEVEFSYIWVANVQQSDKIGTVSKVDTRTMNELGRYLTMETWNPNGYQVAGPSRTSVNLRGDVVVADRSGGLTKIAASERRCVDRNADGAINTSTGKDDVLAWDEDECVLWSIDLPPAVRPVAWTIPEQIGECEWEPAQVWTSAPTNLDPMDPAHGGATVYLVNGEDGTIDETVELAAADVNAELFGLYGGAVDGDNNFWTFPRDGGTTLGTGRHGSGPLIRVNYDTLDYDVFAKPADTYAYGIMIDAEGNPWISGDGNTLARFDPSSQQWTEVDLSATLTVDGVLRGLMQGESGDIWVAVTNGFFHPNDMSLPPCEGFENDCGVLRVDGTTATVKSFLNGATLTGLKRPAGISIDVDGFVWMVDTDADTAYRIDPANDSYLTYDGLDHPYTYSDMTGFGLLNVRGPQG